MDDMEKLLNNAIVYAKSYKGVLPLLAKETGLGYQWLKKFTQGHIPDPGISKIGVLLNHSQKAGKDFSKGLGG